MAIIIRKSRERGHINHGWLDTYHTFSFGEYTDNKHMGFRSLRVINEDKVQKGYGFDFHPHKNMEIITYVVSGTLKHRDNLGGNCDIGPGNVQIMSAGNGIIHSETNEGYEDVHLLQIWIIPDTLNVTPRHEEEAFIKEDKLNKLCLIASSDKDKDNFHIHQDAHVYCSLLESGKHLSYPIQKGRGVWIQLIKGKLEINGTIIEKGDGAAIEDTNHISIMALEESEFLLFDLA